MAQLEFVIITPQQKGNETIGLIEYYDIISSINQKVELNRNIHSHVINADNDEFQKFMQPFTQNVSVFFIFIILDGNDVPAILHAVEQLLPYSNYDVIVYNCGRYCENCVHYPCYFYTNTSKNNFSDYIHLASEKVVAAWSKQCQLEEYESTVEQRTAELNEIVEDVRILIQDNKKLNSVKYDLLSVVSHELNTPLTSAITMAEVLDSCDLPDDESNYVKILQEAHSNLQNIIEKMLCSVKGTGKCFYRKFYLKSLVMDCCKQFKKDASQKNISFDNHYDECIPLQLIGDPFNLRKCIENILDNAVKFTHDGYITMAVTLKNHIKNRVRIVFAVEDSGVGIPADQHNTIFTAFSQVDQSRKRMFNGIGAGLAMTKNLISSMEGIIWVDKSFTKGARIIFELTFKLPTNLENKELRGHYEKENNINH